MLTSKPDVMARGRGVGGRCAVGASAHPGLGHEAYTAVSAAVLLG